MAYWWVSQNKTYRHERGGGYLWAPARDKSGHTPQHWRTMLDVQPGDLIFSYVGQHIRSLAVAGSSARPDIRPPEFSDQSLWKQEGYRIDVSYEDRHSTDCRGSSPPPAKSSFAPDQTRHGGAGLPIQPS